MTSRRTRALSLATLLALTVAAPLASADDEADKKEARALLREGVRLLDTGDRDGALGLFRSAYARYPSAKILVNIGSTLRDLGRAAPAANAYARYLASPDAEPARRAEITKILAGLDKRLGRIELAIDPADAEVAVGDDDWAPAAAVAQWRAAPGTVTIRARRDGRVPAEITVDVTARKVARATIALAEPPPAPVAAPPVLTPDAPVDRDDGAAPRAPTPTGGVRPGLSARAIIDAQGRGAAGSVGALLAIGDRLQLHGAAILGATYGAYAGASLALTGGRIHPMIAVGAPLFFDDGVQIGGRAAAGVGWRATPRVSLLLELGAEYLFTRADDIDAWVIAPAIAAEARL